MAYTILINNEVVIASDYFGFSLIDPVVTQEVNTAGSFVFTLPHDHPISGNILIRKTMVTVRDGSDTIFHGFVASTTEDFFGNTRVSCEGSLAFLNDTIQRPRVWTDMDLRQFVQGVINTHNNVTPNVQRVSLGETAWITDEKISVSADYDVTLDFLMANTIKKFGGYFAQRMVGTRLYIDWIQEITGQTNQSVALGVNALDITKDINAVDLFNVVLPLGKDKLTISSVNSGSDVLINQESVNAFGYVMKAVKFPNIESAADLKAAGQRALAEGRLENISVDVKAVDLTLAGETFDKIHILDLVHVVSYPHGLDTYMPVTKLQTYLNTPERNTIMLGKTAKNGISRR